MIISMADSQTLTTLGLIRPVAAVVVSVAMIGFANTSPVATPVLTRRTGDVVDGNELTLQLIRSVHAIGLGIAMERHGHTTTAMTAELRGSARPTDTLLV